MRFIRFFRIFFFLIVCFSFVIEATSTEIVFRTHRLSDRVLFIKSGRSAIMSNTIAIATTRGLVVIDVHYKPACGQEIRHIIEETFGRNDFAYMIYTHAGVDHMGGAQAFSEAVLVGHDNCTGRINRLRERLQSVDIREVLNPRLTFIRNRIDNGPSDEGERVKLDEALYYWTELAELLHEGIQYPKPMASLNDNLTLHLGEITLFLQYCTPGYSESDIFIHIPEEKLLIVGDIFNKDRIPLLNANSDIQRWLELFKPFVQGQAEIRHILGGHDEIMNLTELKDHCKYLEDLREGVLAAKKEGLTLEQVKEHFAFNKRYPYLAHLNISWISTPDNLHERNIEILWKIK